MLVKCEDVFRFKKHSNRRGRGLKLADIPNAVNNVSCKPGYAFCDNKVDLPGLAVMEPSNKAVALLQRRTGPPLICINIDEFPVLLAPDHILIMVFLQFVGRSLVRIIS